MTCELTWHRISGDSIGAAGYLISRYRLDDTAHFTAWSPTRELLASYWGESADAAKAACADHAQGREHEAG